MGDNLEGGYLGGVLNVGANTSAEVVVADAHQAQGLAGVVGQFSEVYLGRHLFSPAACQCPRTPEESLERLLRHLRKLLPQATEKQLV